MSRSGQKILFSALGALTIPLWVSQAWSAVEYAKVVSRTPLLEQVLTPREVCRDETATVQPAKSGTGAVVGAIAGGVLGHQVGDGSGRVIATTVGAIGGAMIGDRLEPTPATRVITTRRCVTEQVIEQRIAGYDVVYELGGKTYRARLDRDPGETLAVEIAPVQVSAAASYAAPTGYTSTPGLRYGTTVLSPSRVVLPTVGVHYVYVDRHSDDRRGYRGGNRDGYRDEGRDRHRWGERRKYRHDH